MNSSKPGAGTNWAEVLKKFNEGKPHKAPAENDREADIQFLKLLEEEK